MKITEIRGKDDRELALDLQALNKELFTLRFHGAAEDIKNTARFNQIRRSIARIKTVQCERRRAASAGGDAS